MNAEEKKELIQIKLSRMSALVAEICELGLECGVDYVDFMGHQIRFAVDGDPAHDRSARIMRSEWSASSFGCYPDDGDWEWFHGPNPPLKPYDCDY